MSLNKKVMDEYESETGRKAIYKSNGITRHFLPYVDWLEDRLLKMEAQNLKSPNKQSTKCQCCGSDDDGHNDLYVLCESCADFV